jgi:hypothetical protein
MPTPQDTRATPRRVACQMEGCPRAGWRWLQDWAPGVRDGYYCSEHAEALEALLVSGELDAEPDADEDLQ